ncbi:outer membrane protein assembly factor BamA [Histophilus somni]|uniref:Outer membrane protein assembly factor BamA n=1 Tax=Histophilus somni TaxID=731 RepID=A0A9Q7E5K5_HISSO|nr:outer membrane protein assembly factor BamA [Histophilus somni]ARU64791.1 outer membrane protein assembly factor BamA [Histophilus somni]ARU66656.1 outer membrane protein assembly factor BamA [Histophilus somni]ARU68530.1 outer membrane protein assembly factor BamA [Histophilus somni]ARU70409.1 outer membrane protein assembly factor BamA [Histophilus somni]ARU72284.1 outer membrane protein assembly factor BamA [Histophilus somni]
MKKLLIASLLFGSTGLVAAPFVVQDIRINGIQAGKESAVLSGLPVRIGQKATESDISNVVRLLFLRGYDNVQAVREGNTLVISVLPRLVIAEVKVEGNESIPSEAIRENLKANGFASGDILNREKLEAFRGSLVDHYQSVGRYNTTVEAIVNPLSNDRAEVKLKIKESDVAKLKEVRFEGNEAFSSSQLQERMELQPDAWWKLFGNKFDTNQFNQDLDLIRDFYLEHGYAKFQIVGTDVQLNDEKTEVRVRIQVNEGDKYSVNSVRIVGDVGGMSEELAPLLKKIYVGETFRRSEVSSVEQLIKAKLSEQGYATAKVDVSSVFNEENKTIDLTFVVDAGHRYSVRQIRFEGNTITADSTLRQEMRQQEGAWLSSQLVELGKIRLERTGFFESVETETQTNQQINDQVDVIYRVKERNTGSLNFGIGYGTESGISYQASIKQDNFLGMGSSISLAGSRNNYGTSLNLGYNEPYFTKDGVSLGGNAFFEKHDNSKSDTAAAYGRTTYGLSGNLSFPVNENNSYYLSLGHIYSQLKNVTKEYNRDLYRKSMGYPDSARWNFKSHDFEFSFGWNYNSLNRGYLPTSGVRANVGGKVTIPGSDNRYYKVSAEVQGFYPLDRDHYWVLTGRLSGSYANGFGGKRLPFYQTYSAGGIGTVRGFEYGAIGPKAIYQGNRGCNGNSMQSTSQNRNQNTYTCHSKDIVGGNAMTLASIELIVPTPFVAEKNQRSVRTSIFADAGSVWNTKWKSDGKPFAGNKNIPDYGNPARIRASAGIAFQWYSPIGPLVFSYAKPLKKYQGDQIEQFQFSIGGSF